MWIKDKILWRFTEKSDFRREVMEKPIYRGDCLKRGFGQFADLRGGLAKKRGMVFLRGVPRCVTRGEREIRISLAHFQKLEKRVLIFGKNADCGNIGKISHVKY